MTANQGRRGQGLTRGSQSLRYKHASWKARKIELSLKKKRIILLRRRKSWQIAHGGDAAEQAHETDALATPPEPAS